MPPLHENGSSPRTRSAASSTDVWGSIRVVVDRPSRITDNSTVPGCGEGSGGRLDRSRGPAKNSSSCISSGQSPRRSSTVRAAAITSKGPHRNHSVGADGDTTRSSSSSSLDSSSRPVNRGITPCSRDSTCTR